MNEWAPVVVGFSFIILVVALVAVFRRSEWAQDLVRPRGLRGSGANGRVLPRDVLRLALHSFLVAVALFGAGYGAFLVSERFQNATTANLVASTYFFVLILLSAVAAFYGTALAAMAGIVAWRLRHLSAHQPSNEEL